jgi:hypothetical protein
LANSIPIKIRIPANHGLQPHIFVDYPYERLWLVVDELIECGHEFDIDIRVYIDHALPDERIPDTAAMSFFSAS